MSNIYIIEPPTHGKVLLKTTVGEIDIELWSKETPKACRNFIQLCMEGYYNGTIFHRVVKGFIVQGGDPEGTGEGGESVYGSTFKDEFHTRLRFSRRGLIAMANSGKDDNASQFFFTFAPTPELQNKHTIFGKVTGETVFNMLKLEEGMVDQDERPEFPHKIIKTEILNNPFPDIVPRIITPSLPVETERKPKTRAPGVKNFSLLSFGEEAEEEEEELNQANQQFSGKSKSTHDVLNDPKLSALPAVENDTEPENDGATEEELQLEREKELNRIRNKLKRPSDVQNKVKGVKKTKEDPEKEYIGDDNDEEDMIETEQDRKKKKLEGIRKEIRTLKKEMKSTSLEKMKKDMELKEVKEKKEEESEIVKNYKKEQEKYLELKKQIPKKGVSRENFTLSLLTKFQDKLKNIRSIKEGSSTDEVKPDEEKEEKKERKEKKEEGEVDSDNEDWLAHELHFSANELILAKDASTKDDDWFEIHDPRSSINKRRREASKQKPPSNTKSDLLSLR